MFILDLPFADTDIHTRVYKVKKKITFKVFVFLTETQMLLWCRRWLLTNDLLFDAERRRRVGW